ncbi:MAG: transposase [Chlorobia bacterium]|nr:transposase [Fimbriimonadaceae bacterium]
MAKIPLYYTFGNHMHWVDMQWLWGYHVLPGSIRDMLHFCRETGARGNVNFDGIGYEKLAAEDPEALAELREAVQAGIIEPVGCSYGQPYGLFHGGESNIRQRVYGARAVRRLLGVWPKTFWEEEFDFFPQLPQMLRGCGFEYASLFFQWTWHTPEVPKEDVPVVWWEGQDGSRLLCAARNKLNLHQWPEDMNATFAELADSPPTPDASHPTPLILQWLELMPSPDWMCRSELLLPKMRELLADERFEIKMATLGEYLRRSIGFQPMPMSAFQADHSPTSPTIANFLPNEERELTIRQGAKLPHWTHDRAIYHVTFRLADSVPKQVQEEWSAERQRLDRLIAENRLSDKEKFEYQRLYTEKIENFLDAGHGDCLLANPIAAEIVARTLQHFDLDRYRLWAWAVMPNHVHAVVEPVSNDLAEIVHSWKSFTSNRINEVLSRQGTVWQREYYDHIVRNSVSITRVSKYVEENPTKAGLVNWPWAKNNWTNADETQRQDAFGTHRLEADATIPVRKYSMDDVWHGMSLGKNADYIRQESRDAEEALTSAEALFSTLSLFGRPYAQWDVYPTWELEEGWRKLLSAQHHDNDECEGLCARVAYADYQWLQSQKNEFADRLRRHFKGFPEKAGFFNPNGWEAFGLPAFSFGPRPEERPSPNWLVGEKTASIVYEGMRIEIDLDSAKVTQFSTKDFSDGVFSAPVSLLPVPSEHVKIDDLDWEADEMSVTLRAKVNGQSYLSRLMIDAENGALQIHTSCWHKSPLVGGFKGALKLEFPFRSLGQFIRTDTPYGVVEVEGKSKGHKKYPTGDWMTSPQWFEEVENAFFGLSFVDFREGSRGVLVQQRSPKQWFRKGTSVECVLGSYDPWDEAVFRDELDCVLTIIPHGEMSSSTCWKVSNTKEPIRLWRSPEPFTAISCNAPNVIPTAFYRETEDFSGKHVKNYAGLGMGYPFVVRLVEFDGIETEATLTVGGTVAQAYKTNHLGQILEELGNPLIVKMRPYEIATIYMDIVEGRKQTRDLDAKRQIWAAVHRVED